MIDMKTKVEKNMIKQMDSRELKIQDQEQQLKFLQVIILILKTIKIQLFFN